MAHLTLALRIANHRISKLAVQLVEEPILLANASEVIQNHRRTMVTVPEMPEWYVENVVQLADAIEEIQAAFFQHGMPFLDDYSTARGIIRQHEAGETLALPHSTTTCT
jgi:hypothetical protein